MNETKPLLDREQPLRAAVDSIPHAFFVVDDNLFVLDANLAGKQLLGAELDPVPRRLCGEALQCIHALGSAEGCGTTDHCPDCVFRRAVAAVLENKPFSRQKARLRLVKDGEAVDCFVLVTASGFDFEGHRRVLLFVEDVTDWAELRDIVPICAACKKIRNDSDFWEHVEAYIQRNTGSDLSHGYCPDCAERILDEALGSAGHKDDARRSSSR